MIPDGQADFGPHVHIERYRLDNGLRVLLWRDASAPVVAYQTWFRVGSRHETPGKTGIAHLFEHLMFNQTQHLAPGEFDRQIEAVGGETNAATWTDWTYYQDDLPAAELELAIRLEAERMQHLTLTDTQVEMEREVVLNERRFRVDDDVEGFLAEELYRLAFSTHPYHWPTIGWRKDIQGITTDDARSFFRTYYAPNNATVVVCGDFDKASLLRALKEQYGPIPSAELPQAHVPAEPAQRQERRATYAKPVAGARALWAYKAPPQTHPDWLVLQWITELLVGGPSARLYHRLVVEDELATDVRGTVAPLADPGLVEFSANLKRDVPAAKAERALDEAILRLHREPVPESELVRIQNRLETAFWSELETASGKAEALGHYESTLGDFRRLFEVPARVLAIRAHDVQRVAAQYLQGGTRTVVVAEPSAEGEEEDE
jgi:zinc protease